MYKVFFNDRIFLLTDDIDHLFSEKRALFYPFSSSTNLQSLMDKLYVNDVAKQVIIYSRDLDNLIIEFKSLFVNIEAGGGLVSNKENKFLFIKRNGIWDLPKGKIEHGETNENGSMREVSEECGISNITLKSELCNTYHIYLKNNKQYLKKTHWYLMYYEGNEPLKPQEEEGIEFANWYEPNNIHMIIENTYASIIDVLKVANVIKKKRKIRFG